MSPRRAKVDRPATDEAKLSGRFVDEDSFIAQNGTLRLSGEDWRNQKRRCFERDSWCCSKCGQFRKDYDLEAHHIKPKGKGGSDDLENLTTRCAWFVSDCHTSCHPEKQTRWTSKSGMAGKD